MSGSRIEHVFRDLGFDAPTEEQGKVWEAAQSGFPTDGIVWLGEGHVRAVCQELHMQDDAAQALVASLEVFNRHPALRHVAWFQYQTFVRSPWGEGTGMRLWPNFYARLDGTARLVDALVLLACVPSVRAFHKERGISAAITYDTLSDLELWIREEKRLTGTWGVALRGWLSNHFSGRLFKLGRLQFEYHPYHYDVHFFRNVNDRRVVAFAAGGQRFRSDGYYDGANGIHDPQGFLSSFRCDTNLLHGTPIDPARGVAKREPLELNAAEWRCIFGKHDPCLGVHIPASGPMDPAACRESFRLAREFFPRHFPERRFEAFTCSSWLLDAQFEDYLKPDSNIVQWLREWLLFPIPDATDHQHLERVFDSRFDKQNLDANPQKSSVQRAIVEHLKKGKDWVFGGSLYFAEDLDWGAQVYRKSLSYHDA